MLISKVHAVKYTMLLHGYFLVPLVILQTFNCVPLQEEVIKTVNLYFRCMVDVPEVPGKSLILLIHGLTASLNSWDGVQDVLSFKTGRRVCAVDLRNHGNSPWIDRFDVPAMAADIAQFIDSLQVDKINIIGHSLGGKVAVHYALNNPDRVNSLVVEDMRPNIIVSSEDSERIVLVLQQLKDAMDQVPDGSNEDEAKKIIVDILKQKMKEAGLDDGIDEKSLLIKCIDGKCQYNMNIDGIIKALKNPDELIVESKGLYKGPTLFIYGKKSAVDVPGDKENIYKLFPKAQLVGVEGADHIIHGNFKEFDDEVIRFLQPLS